MEGLQQRDCGLQCHGGGPWWVSRERSAKQRQAWQIEGSQMVQTGEDGKPIPGSTFAFDHIYGTRSRTSDVYKHSAQAIVKDTMTGINGMFVNGE